MLIHTSPEHGFLPPQLSNLISRARKYRRPILLLGGVLFSLSLLILFVSKSSLGEKIWRNLPYAIQYFTLQPEQLTIDIKHKDYQKLAYQRDIALKQKVLMSTDDDYVPANITYQGKTYKAEIRLKGDWAEDHLSGENWSFRIHLKGDSTLDGMSRFSVHRPEARNYIGEWLFQKMQAREGIIALRYKFLKVIVNGKSRGIYALEEYFDKLLIENNQRPDGVIVAYDEELFWQNKLYYNLDMRYRRDYGYPTADIRPHQVNRTLADPDMKEQFRTAAELLGRLRSHQLKISDVYDTDKFARYFALMDLSGTNHSVFFVNVKLYFNPVTGRLEPVCYDNMALMIISRLTGENYADWLDDPKYYWTQKLLFWEDPEFTKKYIAALEEVSSPEYIKKLFADIEKEMQDSIAIMWRIGPKYWKEAPSYRSVEETISYNAEVIRKKLNPLKAIHAYYAGLNQNKLQLTLGNLQSLPLEVLKVTLDDQTAFTPETPIILAPKARDAAAKFSRYTFLAPLLKEWDDSLAGDLKIHYQILGASTEHTAGVFPYHFMDDDYFSKIFLQQPPNFKKFPFLMVDEANHIIAIQPGEWLLNESLIIPAGYRVFGRQETRINLTNNATILSYSPFDINGDIDHPFSFVSTDGTGQGLTILNAKELSKFQHVVFENLSAASQPGWKLTGAVTLYESNSIFDHCLFLNSRSEDALNIIRSSFTIENSYFKNASSDALDADFSQGEILRSVFLSSHSDAVEFSNSVAKVDNIYINETGNNAINAGDNSDVTLDNIKIEKSSIGVTSKDQSQVAINKIEIIDSNYGVTVYRKKPEFTSAFMTLADVTLKNVNIPYLVQEGSFLTLSQKSITSDPSTVKEFMEKLQ